MAKDNTTQEPDAQTADTQATATAPQVTLSLSELNDLVDRKVEAALRDRTDEESRAKRLIEEAVAPLVQAQYIGTPSGYMAYTADQREVAEVEAQREASKQAHVSHKERFAEHGSIAYLDEATGTFVDPEGKSLDPSVKREQLLSEIAEKQAMLAALTGDDGIPEVTVNTPTMPAQAPNLSETPLEAWPTNDLKNLASAMGRQFAPDATVEELVAAIKGS